MKKILFLIPLLLLFLIPNTYANNVNGYLNNLYTPSRLHFYDLNSTTSLERVSYNPIQMYSNGDQYHYSYFGYNMNGFTFDDFGLGIVFQPYMSLVKGSKYSLTMVFATNNNSYITGPSYSDFGVKIGTSRGMDAYLYPAEDISTFANANFDLGNTYNNYLYGFQYIQSFNSVFTASNDAQYIFVSFSTSEQVTISSEDWVFLGYYLDYVGQNVDSASDISTQVNSVLQDDFLSVEQKLIALDEELSNVDSSIKDQTEQQEQNHKETMDTITDTDSSGATDSAGSFFEDFDDNDFGLSGIITAPLTTIETITSNSCTPINLTIPFVNKNMSLPCMTEVYEEHFGSFLDIYQIITFGIVSYWVCVQIYAMVKGFKNPDKDEIEVMDL